MRISISNIAWDVKDDEKVASHLNQVAIDAIDIAPGKYFQNFASTDKEEILGVKDWWKNRNIEIVGMQALLFGTQGLNMFANVDVREKMSKHLESVMKIGSVLEARKLVFGSPKNRDRSGLGDSEVQTIAYDFFYKMGETAKQYDVILCLEPNPPAYGANFMTTAYETAQVVDSVNHPNIKMQFDSGSIFMNQENPQDVLNYHKNKIGHIHLSEPQLAPLGSSKVDHGSIKRSFGVFDKNTVVTIEMVKPNEANYLDVVKKSVSFVQGIYK